MLFRETVAVYCETTQIRSVGGMHSINTLKQMVHIVTIGVKRVKKKRSLFSGDVSPYTQITK
jgi:hypothetical protein